MGGISKVIQYDREKSKLKVKRKIKIRLGSSEKVAKSGIIYSRGLPDVLYNFSHTFEEYQYSKIQQI